MCEVNKRMTTSVLGQVKFFSAVLLAAFCVGGMEAGGRAESGGLIDFCVLLSSPG